MGDFADLFSFGDVAYGYFASPEHSENTRQCFGNRVGSGLWVIILRSGPPLPGGFPMIWIFATCAALAIAAGLVVTPSRAGPVADLDRYRVIGNQLSEDLITCSASS